MTEDKKVHLILSGRRVMGAKGMNLEVTGCNFNDREIFYNNDLERVLL